ncbi:MAG: hypothetical protein J6T96_00990 [Bacteroidales bacterium]|nr:hypothetical protein [Bacteroidales bacterium]
MKKKIFSAIALVLTMVAFTSCYSTKTYVGEYQEISHNGSADTYTYAKGKQLYLFGGLIPLGHTRVSTPKDGNCEVITKHTFLDLLISGITFEILTMQTVKVNAVTTESNK